MSARNEGSVRGGILWSLVTFVAAKSVTFVSTIVVARIVAPEDFGLLASVLAYLAILELTSDLGMKATVVYESEQGITPRVQTAFTINIALAVLLAGLGVLLAPLIASFFNAESETGLFRLAALNLVFTGLGNVHDSLLLRGMEFKRRIVPQLTMNVVRAATTITLVVVGLAATGLVVGFLAGTAAWVVSLWFVTGFRPRLTIQRSAVRSMLAYGGWASVLDVLAVLGYRADIAVIGRLLGQQALGLYAIAQRLPELVIENVSWNLSIVAFPALAQRRSREGGMAPTTLNLIRYGALFGLSVGVGIALLASPLVVTLFGEKWREAGPVMSALAIMYGLHTIVFPLGDVFKALGRQALMAAINAVSIPVMIAAMVLVSDSGILAVVWARVGVAVLQGIVLFGLVLRVLDVRLGEVRRALRPGVAVAAAVALGAGAVRLAWPDLEPLPLLLGIVAGGLCGVAGLRLFARDEWVALRGLVASRLPSRGAPAVSGTGT